MNKAIKYRVYPTTEQRILFAKTFGCCRKVYNLMLSDKIEGYKATGKFHALTPAKFATVLASPAKRRTASLSSNLQSVAVSLTRQTIKRAQ